MSVSREERAAMTRDELLRAVWLLDEWSDRRDWIRVTDRLPEEKIHPMTQDYYCYPCTFKSGSFRDVRYYKFGSGHWWNGGAIMDQYVIAWIDLTEPYMIEIDIEKLDYKCPVCDNDEIKPGQNYCQICGGRIERKEEQCNGA